MPVDLDGNGAVTVCDLTGGTVATVFGGTCTAGTQSVIWKATDDSGVDASAGAYVVAIRFNGMVASERITLIR